MGSLALLFDQDKYILLLIAGIPIFWDACFILKNFSVFSCMRADGRCSAHRIASGETGCDNGKSSLVCQTQHRRRRRSATLVMQYPTQVLDSVFIE